MSSPNYPKQRFVGHSSSTVLKNCNALDQNRQPQMYKKNYLTKFGNISIDWQCCCSEANQKKHARFLFPLGSSPIKTNPSQKLSSRECNTSKPLNSNVLPSVYRHVKLPESFTNMVNGIYLPNHQDHIFNADKHAKKDSSTSGQKTNKQTLFPSAVCNQVRIDHWQKMKAQIYTNEEKVSQKMDMSASVQPKENIKQICKKIKIAGSRGEQSTSARMNEAEIEKSARTHNITQNLNELTTERLLSFLKSMKLTSDAAHKMINNFFGIQKKLLPINKPLTKPITSPRQQERLRDSRIPMRTRHKILPASPPAFPLRRLQGTAVNKFSTPLYTQFAVTASGGFELAHPPLQSIKPIINQKMLFDGKVRVQTRLTISFASFVGRLQTLKAHVAELADALNGIWSLLAVLQPLLFSSITRVYARLGELLPGLYKVEVAVNKTYQMLNSVIPVMPHLKEIPPHAKWPFSELSGLFPSFHALLSAASQLLRKVQPCLRRSSIQANKRQQLRDKQVPILLLMLHDINNEIHPNVRQVKATWSKIELPQKLQLHSQDLQQRLEQLQSAMTIHIKPILLLLQPLFDTKFKTVAPTGQKLANHQSQLKKLERFLREDILPILNPLHFLLSIVRPVPKSKRAPTNQVLLYRLRQGINERLYPTVQKLCSLLSDDEGDANQAKEPSVMLNQSMDMVNELYSEIKKLKPLFAQVISPVRQSKSKLSLLPALQDFEPKIEHLRQLVDHAKGLVSRPDLKSGTMSAMVNDLKITLSTLQPHLHNLRFLIEKESKSADFESKLAHLQESIYHLHTLSRTALPVTRRLQKQLSEEGSMTAVCNQVHNLTAEMQPLLSLVHSLVQKLKFEQQETRTR